MPFDRSGSAVATDVIYSKPLNDHQIRVLSLHPGTGEDRLACRLHTVDVADGTAAYEAISYVWGSRDTPDDIWCEVYGEDRQARLLITRNASDALKAIRKPQDERQVWIDSICISQTDSVEKSAQVAIMDSIFANATLVLVWLGKHDDDRSRVAANLFKKWTNWWEDAALLQRESVLCRLPPSTDLRLKRVRGSPWYDRTTAASVAYSRDEIDIMLDVLENEWFWRLWCLQELILAKEVLMHWGDLRLSWTTFANLAAHLHAQRHVQVTQSGLGGVQNVLMLEHLRSQMKGGNERHLPFSRLLSLTRIHGVTEHRDRIFSLLGLDRRIQTVSTADKDSLGPLVTPNYSQPLDEIYLSIARKLITREGNLHLLSFVQHDAEIGTGSLPSWVPQWHTNKHRLITQVDLVSGHPINVALKSAWTQNADIARPTQCSQETRQRFHVTDDGTLQVKGFLLTTVSQSCADVGFAFDSGNEWISTLRTWFHTVVTWLTPNPHLGQTWIDAFQRQQNHVAFRVFYRTLFGGHLRIKDVFFQLRHELRAFRDLLYSEGVEQVSSCLTTRRLTTQLCRSRTLFLTTEGLVGIGPQYLRARDSICLLSGAAVPVLMRQHPQTLGRWLLVGETYVNGLACVSNDYEAAEDFEALHVSGRSFAVRHFLDISKTRKRDDLKKELRYRNDMSECDFFERTGSWRSEDEILKDFVESTASSLGDDQPEPEELDLGQPVVFLID